MKIRWRIVARRLDLRHAVIQPHLWKWISGTESGAIRPTIRSRTMGLGKMRRLLLLLLMVLLLMLSSRPWIL